MIEVRCAVGEPNGLRSTVWKIWTHNRSIYAQSRMMGSSTKLSLHPDGKAFFSITSEWYAKNRPNRHRHLQTWEWSGLTVEQPRLVLTISVPGSELREIPTEEELSEVRWLPLVAPGHVTEVLLWISPIAAVPEAVGRHDYLAALSLDDAYAFVLVLLTGQLSETAVRFLKDTRDRMVAEAAKDGTELTAESRSTALYETGRGGRRLLEFVPG